MLRCMGYLLFHIILENDILQYTCLMGPIYPAPPQKTDVKCNVITRLPLKDSIQLFPIPDTDDVYPAAELLLRKQTRQNKTAYYRKMLSIVSSCCLIIFEVISEFVPKKTSQKVMLKFLQ